MPAVEHSLVHGILHFEWLHHRAGVEVVDPQTSPAHFVDHIHVLFGVVVENVSGTPGTLHF